MKIEYGDNHNIFDLHLIARLDRLYDQDFIFTACERVFNRCGKVFRGSWDIFSIPVISIKPYIKERIIHASMQAYNYPLTFMICAYLFLLLGYAGSALSQYIELRGAQVYIPGIVLVALWYGFFGGIIFFISRFKNLRYLKSSLAKLISTLEGLKDTNSRDAMLDSLPERQKGLFTLSYQVKTKWQADPHENRNAINDILNAGKELFGEKGEVTPVGYALRWESTNPRFYLLRWNKKNSPMHSPTAVTFYPQQTGTEIELHENQGIFLLTLLFSIATFVFWTIVVGNLRISPLLYTKEFLLHAGWAAGLFLSPILAALITLKKCKTISKTIKKAATRLVGILESYTLNLR